MLVWQIGALNVKGSTLETTVWSRKENHINTLEIKTAFFALKCFASKVRNKHVRLLINNTAAVACLNKMRSSRSQSCNTITTQLWEWCITNSVWLSAAHIPEWDNVAADLESRRMNSDAQWKLNNILPQSVSAKLNNSPSIDLFPSRLNMQFPVLVSYWPDPEALAIDAFTVYWRDHKFYAFPPFSLIPRILQKVEHEESSGVLGGSRLANPGVVSHTSATVGTLSCHPSLQKDLFHLPNQPEAVYPLVLKRHLSQLSAGSPENIHRQWFEYRISRLDYGFFNNKGIWHIKKWEHFCIWKPSYSTNSCLFMYLIF